MTLPRKQQAPPDQANSTHFYNLDNDDLFAWITEWLTATETSPQHRPSVRVVKQIGALLAGRQRHQPNYGCVCVTETIEQIATQLVLGKGGASDALAFLTWSGLSTTLRKGGSKLKLPTVRYISTLPITYRANPEMKELDQQGINGSHNGIEADHLGLLPETPRVTKSYQERDKTARSSSAVSAACVECHGTGYEQRHQISSGWTKLNNRCSKGCKPAIE